MYLQLLFVALFVDVCCVLDEHDLQAKLFQNYVKTIRPVKNHRDKIDVQLATNLMSVVKLDERNQELTLLQAFDMQWTDEYLGWEGTQFSSILSITVSSDLVWIPDIVLINGHKIESTLPANRRYVRINRNGVVELSDALMITIGCQFEVADFPFDKQNCALNYNPWLHMNDTVTLSISVDYEQQTLLNLKTNPEWDIFSFKGTEGVDTVFSDTGEVHFYDKVDFTLSMRRLPFYFILTFGGPSFAITCVCLVGLFTPTNSAGLREEKVTLGLTTLLTMSVILNIVTDTMPRSGNGMPKLGTFIMIEMVVAACGTLVTVVIMFLHERAVTRAWPVPRFGKSKVAHHKEKETLSQLRTMSSNAHFAQLKELTQALVSCYNSLERTRKHVESKLADEKLEENWGRIFDNVDLVMSVLFFVANVALSLDTLKGVAF